MKRRHVLQSVLGGILFVARLHTHFSVENNDSPPIFVADETERSFTFEFTLDPENRAYILFAFENPIELQYVANSQTDVEFTISTIKSDAGISNEAAYTRYPALSHEQVNSVTGSQIIPAGTGRYMLCFRNKSEGGAVPFLGTGSTAEVQYNCRITTISHP